MIHSNIHAQLQNVVSFRKARHVQDGALIPGNLCRNSPLQNSRSQALAISTLLLPSHPPPHQMQSPTRDRKARLQLTRPPPPTPQTPPAAPLPLSTSIMICRFHLEVVAAFDSQAVPQVRGPAHADRTTQAASRQLLSHLFAFLVSVSSSKVEPPNIIFNAEPLHGQQWFDRRVNHPLVILPFRISVPSPVCISQPFVTPVTCEIRM